MFGNSNCPLCKGTGYTEKGFMCAWMEIPRVRNTFKALFIILMLLVASINVKAQTATTKEKCTATTTKGVQCKKTATKSDHKCGMHSVETPRCGTTTASGGQCRLIVKTIGDKCHHHSSSTKH